MNNVVNTHQSTSNLSGLSVGIQSPNSRNEEFYDCFEEDISELTDLEELIKLSDDEWSHLECADVFEEGEVEGYDEFSRTPSPLPPPLYHSQLEDSFMSDRVDLALDNLFDNSYLIDSSTHDNNTGRKLSYRAFDKDDFSYVNSPKRRCIQSRITNYGNATRIMDDSKKTTDHFPGFKRTSSVSRVEICSDLYPGINGEVNSDRNTNGVPQLFNSSQLPTAPTQYRATKPQAKAGELWQPTVQTLVQGLKPSTSNVRLTLTGADLMQDQPPVPPSTQSHLNTHASNSIQTQEKLAGNAHLFSSTRR